MSSSSSRRTIRTRPIRSDEPWYNVQYDDRIIRSANGKVINDRRTKEERQQNPVEYAEYYNAEEQPDFLVKLLNNFFSGNSTTWSGD